MESDAQLLAQYASAGDEGAFRVIVERHIAMVHGVARRQAGDQLAEDITQAVFILLARRAKKMPREILIAGWLYQTARLAARHALRGERRRRRHEREAVMQAFKNPRQDSAPPETGGDDRGLDAALARLKRRELEAILGRYYQNMTHEELAREIGITPAAAQKRVERALARLRGIILGAPGQTIAEEQMLSALRPATILPAGLITSVVTHSLSVAKGVTAVPAATTIAKGVTQMKRMARIKLAAVICLCIAAGATITAVAQSELKAVPAAASPPPETAAMAKLDPLFAEVLQGYTASVTGEQKWVIEGFSQPMPVFAGAATGTPQKYTVMRDGRRVYIRESASPASDLLTLDDPGRFGGDVIFARQTPGKPVEDVLVSRAQNRLSSAYYGAGSEAFFEGYLLGLNSNVSLQDALAMPLPHQQAKPQSEAIDGHACFLIQLKLPIGRVQVWLDPAAGYLPRRAIVERSVEEIIKGDPEAAVPGPDSGGVTIKSTRTEMDQIVIEKIDGRWMLAGTRISYQGDYSDHSMVKSITFVRREKINLKPAFDETSFDLAIPDGTPVRILSPQGALEEKTGVWQGGKPVLPPPEAANK